MSLLNFGGFEFQIKLEKMDSSLGLIHDIFIRDLYMVFSTKNYNIQVNNL